jgi:hypothetical protein
LSYYHQENCLNKRDVNGITPLVYCIFANDTKMIKRLLSMNADPNIRTNLNANAFWFAAAFANKNTFLQLLPYTEEIDLKANFQINDYQYSFIDSVTPIEVAFEREEYDLVRILKDCGASIDPILREFEDTRWELDKTKTLLWDYLLEPLSLKNLIANFLHEFAFESKSILDELPKSLKDRVLFKF